GGERGLQALKRGRNRVRDLRSVLQIVANPLRPLAASPNIRVEMKNPGVGPAGVEIGDEAKRSDCQCEIKSRKGFDVRIASNVIQTGGPAAAIVVFRIESFCAGGAERCDQRERLEGRLFSA